MNTNKISNPIEFLIEFAWTNGADKFTVNNAKDELNKLRQQLTDESYINIAWVKVNKRGDFYDPRLQLNPFETNTIPVYANKEELKAFLTNNNE